MRGLCTECGLEFEWCQVFVLTEHPWLFEYHWRRGPVRRLLRSITRSLRPWSFWRDVKMSDPIYLLPAAVVWITCLLVGLGSAAVSIISSRHSMFSGWGGNSGGWEYWRETIVDAVVDMPGTVWRRASGGLLVLVAMPIVFALLPTTLRRARVRRAHVLRIWLYSLSFPALLAIVWLAIDAANDWLGWYELRKIVDPWRWFRSGGLWTGASADEILASRVVPGAAVAALTTGWMMFFWFFAVKRYLKLPSPGLIVVSLGVIVLGLALGLESFKWMP